MSTMRALVYRAPNEVALAEVPRPTIAAPGDAIVRVTLAGICGTDLHVVRGDFAGIVPGTVVGHEFVGDVVEVGAAVQRFKAGDAVMASDFTACGRCRWCERDEHWQCRERAFFGTGTAFGPALPGAQAEYVRVPHADCTLGALPPGCSPEAALLIGDNLATAWTAVERARLDAGECVAVIGGGAIGQLTGLAAQAAGAGAVLVVEPNETRRAFARAQGSISATPQQAVTEAKNLTDGAGADVVVEAVGSNATLELALALVRPAGRIVSVGAHAAEGFTLPIARAFRDELTIGFAIGDGIRSRRKLLRMVSGGTLDPTVIIDARGRLDDAPALYRRLAAQQCLKAVLMT